MTVIDLANLVEFHATFDRARCHRLFGKNSTGDEVWHHWRDFGAVEAIGSMDSRQRRILVEAINKEGEA